MRRVALALLALVAPTVAPAATASAAPAAAPAVVDAIQPGRDYHSYANLDEMRVRHLDLSLDVDFAAQRLSGVADLEVERLAATATRLVLDTRALVVREAWLIGGGGELEPLRHALGASDALLGAPLTLEVPAGAAGSRFRVRISYQTRPEASGLQWLAPAQTAGRTDPFLFTQSQAIHARSWIPLQDSPGVRMTYEARIHAPPGLRAVMSADNSPAMPADGWFRFRMPQPIPSYLIALAVGRLDYRELGPRAAIYAEPPVVDLAANEFADTEKMIAACETLFGPYRWQRYDMLVLPPSFPYGGMENPRLTFLTPTVLAGDRSLVALIAHELAHSWSGNLVTNATWRDFWLNEGFTVFLESRIIGALYGERRRVMEDALGVQTLRREIASLAPRDQVLAIDMRGRDPDGDGSQIPYEKGRYFLVWLESRVGREPIDAFLRGYFDHFAFQSITTEQFRDYLERNLLAAHPGAVSGAELDEWLLRPGVPAYAVLPESDAFARVDALRRDWLAGRATAEALPGREWSTFEWLHFLDNMPADLTTARMAELDSAWALTSRGNAEIAFSWLRLAIRHGYAPATPRLEQFLLGIGRRKLIRPLYEELMKTPDGARFARDVYARARPGYHPIAIATLDPIIQGRAGKR